MQPERPGGIGDGSGLSQGGRGAATVAVPQSAILVAADTVAECDGFVLGKPRDEDACAGNAAAAAGPSASGADGRCASGRSTSRSRSIRVAVTQLGMDELSDDAIDEYLATGQWEGKAGAFGYQDRLGWVHVESGSESNVVGLPMEMLAEMLAEVGADNVA